MPTEGRSQNAELRKALNVAKKEGANILPAFFLELLLNRI